MKQSVFLWLNKHDLVKGFLMAILGALLSGAYQAINEGTINFTWAFWKPIVITSVGAGIAYLIKNLFTNSEGTLAKPEK